MNDFIPLGEESRTHRKELPDPTLPFPTKILINHKSSNETVAIRSSAVQVLSKASIACGQMRLINRTEICSMSKHDYELHQDTFDTILTRLLPASQG